MMDVKKPENVKLSKHKFGKLKKRLFDISFLVPGFGIFIIFMIIPLVLCFYYAFTNWTGLGTEYDMIGFDNFKLLFQDARFFNAVRNTVVIMIMTTIIYNVFGIILAALLNDRSRISAFSRSAFFVPAVMSAVVVAFMWTYMIQFHGGVISTVLSWFGIDPFNFYQTPMTTILMMSVIICWNSLGLFIVIYIATLSTIPQELHEAGKVDGAGWFTRFFRIDFPLLAPGITICSILAVSGGLKQFDHIRVMTAGGPAGMTQTVTLFAVSMAFDRSRRGYSSAAILVLFTLIVILTLIQLKISKMNEVEY